MGVSCMRNKDVSFWLFLTPVLIALGLVVVAPLVYGTFYSFTDWNGLTATKFIGFEHYKNLLSDTRFLDSIWFTLKFSVIRSEEHTSELQSRGHLVCRLLLEKKKVK